MTDPLQHRSLCEAFQATAARVPGSVALRTPGDGVRLTWQEYASRVRCIAAGLSGLGVRHGDTVALMLTNRPEFHLVDTAALHLGAVPFSVYNTLAPEQIGELFSNAENSVVVCEEQFLERLRAAVPHQVMHIVCVDAAPEGTISLATLENEPDPDFDFEASWRAVQPTDVLTIIYTSGTTGPPKGVEITHAGSLAQWDAAREFILIDENDRAVSYLPDAHIANRCTTHYTSILSGMQITTLADIKQAITALPDARPTVFAAVPQVWYKMKGGLESILAAEKSPSKKRLASWAIDVGRRRARLRSERTPIPVTLSVQHMLAERLVLGRIRGALGLDKLRLAGSGAAAIAPEALEFIIGLGIPCTEGWGMSEVSGLGTINRPDAIRIGTVGTALKNVELKLAEDGELLVRGPILMKGYRNEPEKTAEAIDGDGWLHTGDIATIDNDGYVRIVDRKKELIINAAGKNMSPANIEGTIAVSCPLVGSVVAVGDDRPYVVALLTLDPDAAAAFAASHGIPSAASAALAGDPAIRTEIEAGMKVANDRLSRVEQIKKFVILPDVWEPGGEELTPTMKVKRRAITKKYASEIESQYS